ADNGVRPLFAATERSMKKPSFAAVILAAGAGTRMKSDLPKVMHAVAGRPMIAHLMAALDPLMPAASIAVIGPAMQSVADAVAPAECVVQDPPRGTGDAVKTALGALDGRLAPSGPITDLLVLFGDTPLVTAATLAQLLAARREEAAAVLVAAMRPADPGPYGRLVLGPDGTVEQIVEAAEASAEERRIGLVNAGIMALDARHAPGLVAALDCGNNKGEFYLTDIVGIARRNGLSCGTIEIPAAEVTGVNTRAELAAAEALMQERLRRQAMANGATLVAPETVFLCADTRFGRDVVVEPNVTFGSGVTVGDRVHIRSFSHVEGAEIGNDCSVGPFARLRPGAVLEGEVHIGNFVEVKAARLGAGAKAHHLSYIGDSEVGRHTNIGAGTITCNYDGFKKHQTIIGEDVFIGSNTALVAPVTVGAGAIVAAGSVVTSDVPENALTLGRGRQVDKPGRAEEIRAALRRKD
ncbi:MAG TPA: bifunctional UDP-N-acetylglucosamine diphosphorylase/glucosamine-1-phosphate N-acetyltransferase GlmU, partial [Stellaceae bacterium]